MAGKFLPGKITKSAGGKSGSATTTAASNASLSSRSRKRAFTTLKGAGMAVANATTDQITCGSSAVPATRGNTSEKGTWRPGEDVAWKKTLEIPWCPPSLNRQLRMHWSKRRKLTELAGLYIANKIGVNTEPPDGKVVVTIKMYRWNPVDADGAHGGCKPLFDAIVRLGWARDDSAKWMHQVMEPVVIDRKNPRTVISIEYGPVR